MNSIRMKLLVSFGLTLVILLCSAGVINYLQVKDTVVPLTKELSAEILEARSAEMGRLVDGYVKEVKAISQLEIIRTGNFEEISGYLAGIPDDINPHYEMVFYADQMGNFTTTNGLQGNISDREYYRQIILGSAEHYITDPLISRSTGEKIFIIAWEAVGIDGETHGILGATVLLDTLSGIAGEINIGEKGFGYVVDQSGLLVAHPDETLRMSLNFIESNQAGYTGLAEIGQAMAAGQSGIMTYTRPDGVKLITAFNPIPDTPGWSLGVAMYENELLGKAYALIHSMTRIMLAIIAAVLVLVYILSGQISRPIALLTDGVRTVSSGNLDRILEIKTGDEIEDLADAFNRMTADLKAHIRDLQETTAVKERIESELQVANRIQASMLPRSFPPYPDIRNLDLYAQMEPAREVGGDFYDFFPLDNHRFCFSVGDVSGKGIPAALFMVITRTILKNQAMQGSSIGEFFYRANNLLCSDNAEDMFVTVFMGILDTHSGMVEYVSAGHNPPMLCRQGGAFGFLDVERNFVLGGIEDFRYQSQRLQLDPGDVLFLYTDGANEAMNHAGSLYGETRMTATLDQARGASVRRMIGHLHADISAFVGKTPASDDLTMLALTLKEP